MDFEGTFEHLCFTEAGDAYIWNHLRRAIARSSHSNESERWVKLCHPPDYSFDEALLVCQANAEEWVAWVPEVGIILLQSGEFYV
jgi:hypothetical protein